MTAFLKGSGWQIKRHREYFSDDADDDLIIEDVTRRGWVLLSADKRIEKESLPTIVSNRARLILLSDNNSGWRHWAGALVTSQEKIEKILADSEGPMIIHVSKSGHVSSVQLSRDLALLNVSRQTQKIARAKKTGTYGAPVKLSKQRRLFTAEGP